MFLNISRLLNIYIMKWIGFIPLVNRKTLLTRRLQQHTEKIYNPTKILKKKVDKFQMESIGKVLLSIKKSSGPRKECTSKLYRIIEENVEKERQARREADKRNITWML